MITSPTSASPASDGAPRTVAEALGQIVWLLSQSALHRELKLKDLEWSFMPPVLKEQFRVFRFGTLPPLPGLQDASPAFSGLTQQALEQLPLGVAIWANLSEVAERKLEQGQRLELEEWNSGDRLWLIEFVTPFATPGNGLAEAMLTDLLTGPFAGKLVSMHRTDPQTGRRDKVTLNAPGAEAA
ncbi:toxin-activating lysine-acyltransferase [Stenotrophomonas rhizophila]|uniref:toxin-activating lysine-acyltransferase n=1 Tax=Stenotrophomonas rhizophila TaxID=216778 RepID=UPI000456E861|nr:toxin-activating lysine-acyltransferase [Stenotrophomonas rhizophila]AHY59911.1 RTX toxin-activating protein C [Stenotrophomonas rhizophila]